MNTPTRILLIALRIAIGWHFLYEGLFKIGGDTTSAPYDTARYKRLMQRTTVSGDPADPAVLPAGAR